MSVEKIHFIGIGGIGMSALARVLLQKGCKVQGSDASSSPLVEQLRKEGAEIQIGHNADFLLAGTTVVYSTDIRPDNVELVKAKKLQLPLLHRSEMLDRLMEGKKSLLVTGTHGKTTTTALLSAVLLEAGMDPSFVIGGILRSLGTNGKAGKGAYFVAEADESDGSSLRTSGYGSIVTNLENEHLSYWNTEKRLDEAFGKFFANTQNPKHLFWCCDDPRLRALHPPGSSYGFSEQADAKLSNYRAEEKGISFDLAFQERKYQQIELSLLGRHNALNGAAVFGLASSLNAPESAIRAAFKKFAGTKRRLEWLGEERQIAIYDDYGHHPTEIAATLKALREQIGKKRLVAVFQPHRFSRVRDCWGEFRECFEDADLVILTDIYSAGEAPIDGITSHLFLQSMRQKLKNKIHFIPRSKLESEILLALKPFDVLLTVGAGDITRAGAQILKGLSEKKGGSQ